MVDIMDVLSCWRQILKVVINPVHGLSNQRAVVSSETVELMPVKSFYSCLLSFRTCLSLASNATLVSINSLTERFTSARSRSAWENRSTRSRFSFLRSSHSCLTSSLCFWHRALSASASLKRVSTVRTTPSSCSRDIS